MYTISIDEIKPDSIENIEIWVEGKRRITLSLNHLNTSIQIPGGFDPTSMNNSEASAYLRTRNFK